MNDRIRRYKPPGLRIVVACTVVIESRLTIELLLTLPPKTGPAKC